MDVRARIISVIKTRLEAVSAIGTGNVHLAEPGELSIGAAVAGGKYVVELYVGPDRAIDPPETHHRQSVDVAMLIHMPTEVGTAPSGWTLWNHEAAASWICGQILATYTGDTTSTDPQLTDGTGATAIDAKLSTYCGGVEVDERFGTLFTLHELTVDYRFAYGQPGVVA
jgi:hypothetical protein